MKAYLAARSGRRAELLDYAAQLAAAGVEVTSHWIDGHHEVRPDVEHDATDDEQRSWALEDITDLRAADTLIFFGEAPGAGAGRARGGRHVEYGMALALGHDLVVVGPPENVFHSLRKLRRYPDFAALLAAIQRPGGIWAGHGAARRGRRGLARPGTARRGAARRGEAWRGLARRGTAGKAWRGAAGRGVARRGWAWSGVAGRGTLRPA